MLAGWCWEIVGFHLNVLSGIIFFPFFCNFAVLSISAPISSKGANDYPV